MKTFRRAMVIGGLLFVGSAALLLAAEDAESGGSARIRPHPLVLVRTGVSREVRSLSRPPATTAPAPRPGVVTRATQRPAGSMPAPSVSFEGIGNVNNHAPADTNIAVGPTAVGQIMRDSFRLTDRSGISLTEIMEGRALWTGFEGSTCRPDGGASIAGEPVVLYDRLADRWVWTAWALTGEHHQCFAVSMTGDPLGAYYLYDFLYEFAAYGGLPRFGMWPDAYYMTATDRGSRSSPTVVAFDRNAMLAGLPVSTIGVSLENPDLQGLLPSTLDGLEPPPDVSGKTAPNVLMALGHPDRDGSPTSRIHVYYFHPEFADPESSTFTGPLDLEVDAFQPAASGAAASVVPQPDQGATLEAIANPEYRLTYRNFGDHESMVLEHSVFADTGRLGPRWYEIRDPLGSPFVHQQGTWGPDDGVWRWTASAAMDKDNNLAIGYSVSNDTDTYPGIRYAGRLATDPLGELSQGEAELIAGERAFADPRDPKGSTAGWGFYNSLVVDPVDDCTFWYTNMYTPAAAEGDYSTRIGAFKFDGCTASPTGTLEGTVTDGTSPIANARVSAGGSIRFTDSKGHFALTLPAATYDMTASVYGFSSDAASGVTVTAGEDTIRDFVLSRVPTVLVNGIVLDGSGGNWPLYAKVVATAPGKASFTTYTDPATGYYAFTLAEGLTYMLTATAVTPGYQPGSATVLLPSLAPASVVKNFALVADLLACEAPGYTLSTTGLAEGFDEGSLPKGWSIETGDGGAWEIFSEPSPCGGFGSGFAGNLTGGDGPFAVQVLCGDYLNSDSSLITPPVDLSGFSTALVRFNSDFPCCYADQTGDVDISTDGASTWSNVLHLDFNAPGPRVEQIDITSLAAGQPDVRARFHFTTAVLLWWQIDDVVLGQASCSLGSGGLVVGHVRDGNTGAGLNGASVRNLPDGASTVTFATPEDPNQDDGLYILFAESALQQFEASLDPYTPLTKSVIVIPTAAVRLDFDLAVGRLDANPRLLSVRVDPGQSVNETVTLTNSGGIDASFQIHTAGTVLHAYPSGLAFPYGVTCNTDARDLWLSNLGYDFPGDNQDYRFLANGSQTSDTIDLNGGPDVPMDGAYNPNTGMLWQVFGLYDIGCLFELDPVARVPTGNSICPKFETDQHALAYDPATDTYYSGSLNDARIYHFDSSGAILDSVDVVAHVSGLAFNPVTRHLFVLHQDVGEGAGPDVFVVDPAKAYAVVDAFYIGEPGAWGYGVRGMDLDCHGHLWLVAEIYDEIVVEVESGEAGPCGVSWLSIAPPSGTVKAGSQLSITVSLNAANLAPGLRRSQLNFTTNTPYALDPVPVNLTIRFLDVPDGSFGETFIYAAAGAGIMPGCGGNDFCPSGVVTRADMAGFIERSIHGSDFVPPPYSGVFADVAPGDFNADYIQGLYDDGITAGCGGGNFCPGNPNTRAQMAAFILKAKNGADFAPPSCGGIFEDVDCPGMFADWIEELFHEEITVGCGDNNYCPGSNISNAQMAVFLVKALDVPHL